MSIQEIVCRDFAHKVLRGEAEPSTVNYVGDLIADKELPTDSGIVCPTGVKPKGRPRGSTKYSTHCKPSGFEHAREKVEKDEKENVPKKKENQKERKKNTQETPEEQDEPMFENPSEVWGSQVCDEPEEPPQSDAPEAGIIHMGVDFGVRNIDYFWYAFIRDAKEVEGDGHCGYRSLCKVLGKDEGCYREMRIGLANHMVANRALYEEALSVLNPLKTIETYAVVLSYVISPCPQRFWCDMPMVGLVFATYFQVALAFLSWSGPCLCLPMTRQGASSEGGRLRVVSMAHVGVHNHFIPVCTQFSQFV